MVLSVSNAAVKQDPIRILPDELVLDVFSYFNLALLGTICLVSKDWRRLANEPILWKKTIYREIAFGNDKWAEHFGKDAVKDEDQREEFSSLPWSDFIADCKKFKSVFPGKIAKDNLMLVRLPKTLNGGLTLKSLIEIVKKDFLYCDDMCFDRLQDKSIDKSHWVLMTKDVLPGSRSKNYEEQQKIIAGLVEKSLLNYEVPKVLEATVCILSHYFGSNIRLFSKEPWTYTRCKDNVSTFSPSVGGFVQLGLRVVVVNDNAYNEVGVAALRKF